MGVTILTGRDCIFLTSVKAKQTSKDFYFLSKYDQFCYTCSQLIYIENLSWRVAVLVFKFYCKSLRQSKYKKIKHLTEIVSVALQFSKIKIDFFTLSIAHYQEIVVLEKLVRLILVRIYTRKNNSFSNTPCWILSLIFKSSQFFWNNNSIFNSLEKKCNI